MSTQKLKESQQELDDACKACRKDLEEQADGLKDLINPFTQKELIGHLWAETIDNGFVLKKIAKLLEDQNKLIHRNLTSVG